MNQQTCFVLCATMFLAAPLSSSEFIKKPKQKKETTSQVKEDIAELLESALRQLGKNIQQSVDVQDQIFDKIKEILGDNQMSADQLKALRFRLELHLKKLEEQQADLYDILLSCKKSCA
jgi:septal ring factor EnvC (AmiA/AmiB activator)